MSTSVKLRYQWSFLTLLLLCHLFSATSHAIEFSTPSNWLNRWRYLFFVNTDIGFPESHADRNSDAVSFGRKFNTPLFFSAGMGIRPGGKWLYLGLRYQFWLTTQDYIDVDGQNLINEFHYQALGGELGLSWSNAGTYWIISAVLYCPLEMRMSARHSGVTFKRDPAPYTYEGRVTFGYRLSRRLALQFDGGYRQANFGNLTANGRPFLPGPREFNMSDVFVGAGLGLTF